jgi:hypothetical protein
MSTTTTQYWTGDDAPFQVYDTTIDWYLGAGDESYYWGFAARPMQASSKVALDTVTGITDNLNNQLTMLTITVTVDPSHRGPVGKFEGTLMRFTAIKVTTP